MVTLKSVFNIRRFKQQVTTSGYVDQDGRGHCISPLLYETGFIPFEVSADDGSTFPYSGTWLSGYLNLQHPSSSCILPPCMQDYMSFPLDQFFSLTDLREEGLAGLMLIHLLRDELSQQLSSSSSIN